MEKQLLKEHDIFPTIEVLQSVFANNYAVYEELIDTITNATCGLTVQWNYYNDGKAWLCKALCKKKTIFWLSVFDVYFKITFFFTEKTMEGFINLGIANSLKADLQQSKPIGKLIPLIININKAEQLKDVLKIIDYKKNLK